jgi:hypothetical protein
MYKNIIPGLVSFDTSLKRLSGCYISAEFEAFPPVREPAAFHYTLAVENSMSFPADCQFRHQSYFKSGECWYYERKLPLGVPLRFSYDPGNKLFRFNEMLRRVPVNIGGILPAGGHLSNIIALDLLLEGYVLMRGNAMAFGDRAACVIGPGSNGKTTILNQALDIGAKYVSDELLLLDMERKKAFPISLAGNLGRRTNMQLKRYLRDSGQAVTAPLEVGGLFLIQNTSGKQTGTASPEKDWLDYLYMLSLGEFYNSPFITAFVHEEGLTEELFERFDRVRNLCWDVSFVRVKDYDFSELLKMMAQIGSPSQGRTGQR